MVVSVEVYVLLDGHPQPILKYKNKVIDKCNVADEYFNELISLLKVYEQLEAVFI